MVTALHVVGTVIMLQLIAIIVGLFVSVVCDHDVRWSWIDEATNMVVGGMILLYGLTIPFLVIAWIWS